MTYDVASEGLVTPEGWVNVASWTGQTPYHLPLAVREPDEALTHVDSLLAALGPGCDPRSGGIAGTAHLAAYVGLTPQHFRQHRLPQLDFVRYLGGIPVTNVASLSAWAEGYREGVRRERVGRLR